VVHQGGGGETDWSDSGRGEDENGMKMVWCRCSWYKDGRMGEELSRRGVKKTMMRSWDVGKGGGGETPVVPPGIGRTQCGEPYKGKQNWKKNPWGGGGALPPRVPRQSEGGGGERGGEKCFLVGGGVAARYWRVGKTG